jgi:hypothetical protein
VVGITVTVSITVSEVVAMDWRVRVMVVTIICSVVKRDVKVIVLPAEFVVKVVNVIRLGTVKVSVRVVRPVLVTVKVVAKVSDPLVTVFVRVTILLGQQTTSPRKIFPGGAGLEPLGHVPQRCWTSIV